ncbi:MAG TPA: hypothetical protein VGM44_20800 [Polyangiaceae bacterium]|jgi:hypothetical protein
MKTIAKRPFLMLSVATALFCFGALASGETADALLRRYPFDPACPWGRIGNGKGIVLRCLTEAETQALRAGTVPAASAQGTPNSSQAVSGASSAAPPAQATPAEDANDADTGKAPGSTDEKLEVTVGPVTAESGELGIGKLGAPKDKYAKCVTDNGGLKETSGEVEVKFLVRARGRAEGVSVAKRTNLSQEAARCVSEVVDRRYVGTPAEPIVGATVVIKFVKAAK